ncbi:hypothetical protein [Castellaniella caeni]|uniref:hypothetical protein n=1 Tax=Castellaniella caeni TaxID=266123 RepID=UPI000C9FAE8B|nr:hypothetical protein [Castellaniella caeni]
MKIQINGVIAWDIDAKTYIFNQWLSAECFEDGLYHSEYSNFYYICDHVIEVDAPEIDLVGPQLSVLDAKEAKLTARYRAAKTEIERQRQSLLAIEA